MKIKIEGGGSCLGVLQPVTSLVSTLSLLKPRHHSQLLKKLTDPPLSSESKSTNSRPKIVSVPLKSKRQPSSRRERKYRMATKVLQTIPQPALEQEEDGTKFGGVPGALPGDKKVAEIETGSLKDESKESEASPMEGSESCSEYQERGFMTSCASDSELYTGLQLLFRGKSDKSMDACVCGWVCVRMCKCVLCIFSFSFYQIAFTNMER